MSKYTNISNDLILHQGATRTLREWCQLLRLNYLTVRMRYKRGETDTEILFKPTPVPKGGFINPSKPRTKKIAQAIYPQAFYNLPYEVREPMMRECEFDPVRVSNLITQLLTKAYIDSMGGNAPTLYKPAHPDDAPTTQRNYTTPDIFAGIERMLP